MSLPPARCVISIVNGADPACMVHTHYAPCPRNGEPASASVVHSYPHPSREAAIGCWRLRTLGQRTLVLHVGDMTDGSHRIGVDDVDCPCGPEVIWAEFGARIGGA